MALVATLIAFMVMSRRVVEEVGAIRSELQTAASIAPAMQELAGDARGLVDSAKALRPTAE